MWWRRAGQLLGLIGAGLYGYWITIDPWSIVGVILCGMFVFGFWCTPLPGNQGSDGIEKCGSDESLRRV